MQTRTSRSIVSLLTRGFRPGELSCLLLLCGAHGGPWIPCRLGSFISDEWLKKELAGMFHSLEKSMKKEITAVRSDMSHLLARIEDTEQRQDLHEAAIKELQETVTQLAFAHCSSLYKLEDLENRNRRNNLRIRECPEATRDNDIKPLIWGILNTILGNPVTDPLRFVHRALRLRNVTTDQPRDVICRLHYFEDKNTIMVKLRSTPNIDFDGAVINTFPDLSKKTLDRHRALKPLLDQLRTDGVTHRWGFPSCLIATKNGRSFTLRFPEELPTFLHELNMPLLELPGWQDPIPMFSVPLDPQWQKTPSKKKRTATPGSSQKNG